MKESGLVVLDEQFDYLTNYIQDHTSASPENHSYVVKKLSHFKSEFKKRWSNSSHIKIKFLERNKDWLSQSISFFNSLDEKHQNGGRPRHSFPECSKRSKRRKTEELRAFYSCEELSYATQMSLRLSGQLEAAKVVKDVTATTPTRAKKYRLAYDKFGHEQAKQISPEETLAMIVEAKLTRRQYSIIRSKAPLVFPSYKRVQKVKQNSYPTKSKITVTPTSAEVELQALLDHSISRLVEAQKDVFEVQDLNQIDNLCLI